MKNARAMMVIGLFCLVGCTSYYKVSDPATGKSYYTTDLKEQKGGAATLKDGRTGDKVTIQSSEVSKVTKEQYEAAIHGSPSTQPMK